MQRPLLTAIGTACLAVLVTLVGCSSKPQEGPHQVSDPTPDPRPGPKPDPKVDPVTTDPKAAAFDALVNNVVAPSKQDQYDTAFREALDNLLDKHFNQALIALQAAQKADDTEDVRRQIAKVQDLLRQQEAAEQTAKDVQTVLTDGKPGDAADLGRKALEQFGGGGDIADNLVQQKREADAVVAAALPTDDDRFMRFKKEGDEARAANNLRAAALAYEQALGYGNDPDLRGRYEAVQKAVTGYEDARRRAAQLRRDPAYLEDALAALDEARQAWDTPQVRQEIDDYTFALRHRRDRVSVAAFEVRGELGIPDAGHILADDLLPHLKRRYDLVEREQIGRILKELNLEANGLVASPDAQQEVGRLARISYLVLGSITPLNGFTVNARLVNVRTGVIEQTARISAMTFAELERRMDVLGQILQMDDDQKERYQQALADQPDQPVEVISDHPVILPPVFVMDAPPPPPIITFVARRPSLFIDIEIGAFRRALPPPPPVILIDAPPPPPPAIEIVLRREDPRRGRLLSLSLELGDNLFRRRQFREAERHFTLALTLSEGNADVALRVDRCRQQLPPPPLVIVAPPPVRPRLIVFSFIIGRLPGLVPPNLGDVASDQFSAYLGQSYEIVDRGEVCWYMGRLGIAFAQIVNDPAARIALARAMNVRYYCFGTVLPTASLDVEAHLMDANSNTLTATGKIHVQDYEEMKLRIGELAAQLGAPSTKAGQALAQKGAASEKALNDARTLLSRKQFPEAKAVAERGLAAAPNSAALKTVRDQADQQMKQAQIIEHQKTAEIARAKAEADIRAKREALAKASEEARAKAVEEARNRSEAAVAAERKRKHDAAQVLAVEAKKAMDAGNLVQAVGDLQSATSLDPTAPELRLSLKEAQTKLDTANRLKADAERKAVEARKAADDQKARDAALAKINAEKDRHAADEKAKLDARNKEVAGLIAAARKDLADKQFGKALAAAQAARQLNSSAETDKLLADIQHEQSLAAIKDEKARTDAEAKANVEREKQTKYQDHLKQGGLALDAKKFDDAAIHYREAQKLFSTDAVLSGIKQAENGARTEKHAVLLDKARAALAAKRFDEASSFLAEANKIIPDSPTAKTLSADVARAKGKVQDDYKLAMDAAKSALKKLNYTGAINAANVALGIIPNDPAAMALIKDAQSGLGSVRKDYDSRIKSANAALAAKKYDEALEDATGALRLIPNDPAALALLKAAQDGKGTADTEARRKADYAAALQAGKIALATKKYDEAVKGAQAALKLFPDDRDAAALLTNAETAKAGALGDATKQTEFQRLMNVAQQAMAARHFEIATKAATDALNLFPNDATALRVLKDANDGIKAEQAKLLQAQYAAAIQAAKDAVAAKRYDEAIKSAHAALKIIPNDAVAQGLLKMAQDGSTAVDTDAKRKADFAAEIQAGKAALTAKRYDDALKAANDALKLVPGDPTATALLKDAQAGKTAADTEAAWRAEYSRQMALGAQAMAANRPADAVKAYTEALRLAPGDPAATKGLADAKSTDKTPPPPPPVPDFKKSMRTAQGFEKQMKWADAAAAYREALKAKPGDPKATFSLNLAEGQQSLSLKRWAEAQKFFEDALKLFPDDADAKALLKRAEDMK